MRCVGPYLRYVISERKFVALSRNDIVLFVWEYDQWFRRKSWRLFGREEKFVRDLFFFPVCDVTNLVSLLAERIIAAEQTN